MELKFCKGLAAIQFQLIGWPVNAQIQGALHLNEPILELEMDGPTIHYDCHVGAGCTLIFFVGEVSPFCH